MSNLIKNITNQGVTLSLKGNPNFKLFISHPTLSDLKGMDELSKSSIIDSIVDVFKNPPQIP